MLQKDQLNFEGNLVVETLGYVHGNFEKVFEKI